MKCQHWLSLGSMIIGGFIFIIILSVSLNFIQLTFCVLSQRNTKGDSGARKLLIGHFCVLGTVK